MRIAEQVTFGGSALDRAARFRTEPARIATLLATGRVLALWRGKPLIDGAENLGWLASDSPVLAQGAPPVFLGLEGETGWFAQDISAWTPDTDPETAAAGFFDASRQTHPLLHDDLGFQDLRSVMARLSPREAELVATAKALTEWHRSHGFCSACGVRSDQINAGWQRGCPSCGTQHFPRTDPVVIMLVEHGNSVLLGRNAAWPEGMYSLLAGFVEPGEPIEAAVRREVFEETGVTVGAVSYLSSQPWPFPASLMFGCRAKATSQTITIDPTELEDALWVTREEMAQVFAGQHPRIKPTRNGAIAHFLLANWLADCLD